ncbi:MAG: serine hydrolase domain-containing protein [Bacteroidota bacterium]
MILQRILILIFFITTVNLSAQSISAAQKEEITQVLYEYVNDDSPGLAVGILIDGTINYENYIGYANMEHLVKIDQNTRFNIASVAKQYTALCVLKLITEGKLGMEDDIRKYLPDLYPTIEEPITVAQLIAHTSGIRDYTNLYGLKEQPWWKQFMDNDDAIALLQAQLGLNFKPGTKYAYSNSNYIIMTELVAKISGEDFSDYAKALFENLGMPSTSYQTSYMRVIPNKARSYGNWNGWLEYPAVSETHGDGGLFTTLKDQLQWETILQANDGTYLSKELINESQSPIQFTYGYGLEFGTYKGLSYTWHNGSTGAYRATVLRFPEKKISVLVHANNGNVNPNGLAKQLIDILLDLKGLDEYPGMPETIEKVDDIKELLGKYKSPDGGIIDIIEKDGALFREISNQPTRALINEEGGLFHYGHFPDLKMNFSKVGTPDQQFTIYLSEQAPATYYRLPDADLSNYDRGALNGRFYNAETDTEISITYRENDTYLVLKNGEDRDAELVAEDVLQMGSYELEIARNAQGNVDGVRVSIAELTKVLFQKQ